MVFGSLALAEARLVCFVLRVTWLFGNRAGNIASNLSHILGLESVQSAYHRFMFVCAPLEQKALKNAKEV